MNIAIIAHDEKKELMVQFCIAYCGILSRYNLCATGTTGKLVSEATGLNIVKYMSGSQGGDQQIAATDVRCLERAHARTVAVADHDVKLGGELGNDFTVVVDEHNVVSLAGELRRQRLSDYAAADNDDLQFENPSFI